MSRGDVKRKERLIWVRRRPNATSSTARLPGVLDEIEYLFEVPHWKIFMIRPIFYSLCASYLREILSAFHRSFPSVKHPWFVTQASNISLLISSLRAKDNGGRKGVSMASLPPLFNSMYVPQSANHPPSSSPSTPPPPPHPHQQPQSY